MNSICVNDLTKDYGNQKGVFHLSFSMKEGETVGFLGSNGAGKTTTLRHLMGFLRPDHGEARIMGLDCFQDAVRVQQSIGYLPGEIAFMDHMTGWSFIQFMAEMKQMQDRRRIRELMERLEINPRMKIKKMSKGMKQKIGLIVALMQDAPILLLDEPTTGLDPLMQNQFVELIRQEKAAGKTILMSSHIFEEVEHTCDRILMIKEGRLVTDESMSRLQQHMHKHFEIVFADSESAAAFQDLHPGSRLQGVTVTFLYNGDLGLLIRQLGHYDIRDIQVRRQSLEEIFLQYYGGDPS